VDAFGVALADEEDDGRGVGGAVVGEAFLPGGVDGFGFVGNGVNVVGEGEGDDVGLRPSITERACLPEPPWDCSISTVWPVFDFQSAAKALLNSW